MVFIRLVSIKAIKKCRREAATQRLHASLNYLVINEFKVSCHQNNDTADGVSLESP